MISRFEELKLIARCLTTDSRSAYSELVREYEGGLRRFLLNLTLGDAMLTDDLAQETFLKAYLSLRSFKGVSRFSTWLYRIAYNEYIGYVRKYSRENAELPENREEEPTEAYSRYDISHDLAKAMSVLKPLIDGIAAGMGMNADASDAANSAISSAMMEAMIRYMPLRTAASFSGGKLSYEALEQMVEMINNM